MSQSDVSESSKAPRPSGFLARLGDLWCRRMHDSPMLPIHGRYQCRKCHRYHDVPWEGPHPEDAKNSGRSR
jgi:hypothetical protein